MSNERRELTSEVLREGGERVFDRLAPLVYEELRRIAGGQMQREAAGVSLQPTALVHEAYMKLVDESQVGAKGRSYFFGSAARAMRQILIDHARARHAQKRGGGAQRVTLAPELAVSDEDTVDVLALEEALEELRALDERQARVVELRFYAGLGVKEVAELIGVSDRTIKTDWQVARAWLRRRLSAGGGEGRDEDGGEDGA